MLQIFFVFFLLFSSHAISSEKKTVCLNMIVKNEKDAIERCLNSVKPLIDYWVIFDTGSSDGTQELIKTLLKDIPGELHESKWIDFSTNRNEAMRAAKNKGDYLLFIDADEIWEYSSGFSLSNLTQDGYHITVQAEGRSMTKRVALVNNHLNWEWKGILHEDISCPSVKNWGLLKGAVDRCDLATGARSKDPKKHLKDAATLKKAFEKEPTNSRYAFYLARTYLNADDYKLAVKYFKKRLELQSTDFEETFWSIYYLAASQEALKEDKEALENYFKAYQYYPARAEPLLRCAVIYRRQGNYLLGYLLSKYALSIPCPTQDLAVQYSTYEYAILVEVANCALLMGKYQEGLQYCHQLLSNPHLPEEIKPSVISNYELARKNLEKIPAIPY